MYHIKSINIKTIILFLLSGVLCFVFSSCSKDDANIEKKEFTGIKQIDVNQVEISHLQEKSKKRGVSYGFQLVDIDVNLLAPGISWFYNWGENISSQLDNAVSQKGINFYPMAWNGGFSSAKITAYKEAHPACEYILAFNEPNLTDQANMTPQQAADAFPDLKDLAEDLDMKIIAPAMNYGTLSNYHDPIKWLDEFFDLVPLSNFSGIAVHCYMGKPSAFKSYIARFKKYDKPIWVTEFCGWENNIGNSKDQAEYMTDVVNYLESDPDVTHYAWFIPRWSGNVQDYPYMQLLTKEKPFSLSDLGKVYINMSTFDKSVYYDKNEAFPAADYVALNSTSKAQDATWVNAVQVQPTSDVSGILEVYGFNAGEWMEYQINVPKDGNYEFDFRRASYRDATIKISSDGNTLKTLDLPNTGNNDAWVTSVTMLQLKKGKRTLRISMLDGYSSFNWFRFR